jgi:metal-responsive CopG/Arc/MetJ family transcriptional regulator
MIAMIAEYGYRDRSEVIRDFAGAGMQQAAQKKGTSGKCVAALVRSPSAELMARKRHRFWTEPLSAIVK